MNFEEIEERAKIMSQEYKTNADFKRIVDNFAIGRGKSVNEALKDAIVFEIYQNHIQK